MSGSQNRKASQDSLEELHCILAEYFKGALSKDDVPPSLLNAARQFLKDNGIEATLENATILEISEQIPTFDEDVA